MILKYIIAISATSLFSDCSFGRPAQIKCTEIKSESISIIQTESKRSDINKASKQLAILTASCEGLKKGGP